MFELIGIYLLGILASSILINLLDWWIFGYDVTVKDVFHPYHLLSWALIMFYIGININDYIDREDNFIGKSIKWAKNKKLLNKK